MKNENWAEEAIERMKRRAKKERIKPLSKAQMACLAKEIYLGD